MSPPHEETGPATSPALKPAASTATNTPEFIRQPGQIRTALEDMIRLEARDLTSMYANVGIPVFRIALSWNTERQSVDKQPLPELAFKNAPTTAARIVDEMLRGADVCDRQVIGVGIHSADEGRLPHFVEFRVWGEAAT